MNNKVFDEQIKLVIAELKKAGYIPYDQLYGYVSTGEISYITRKGDARAIVAEMDIDEIRAFLERSKAETM